VESYQVAFLVALSLTTVAVPITLKILRNREYLDRPNERSSHTLPTPRGAGLAQIVGGAGAFAGSGGIPLSGLIALAGFGALGASDDIKPQSPITRLMFQMAISIVAFALALSSWNSIELPPLLIGAISVLVLVGMANASNFMDGINGISVVHGVIFGSVFGIILWREGLPEWVTLGATLAGVSLAVLPWNWGRSARIFLGDSGSYLLGASIALLFLTTWFLGPGFLVAVAPITIYLTDTGSTLIQRIWKRESITKAHRDHIYQRLIRSGWSHPRTALFVAAFSTATSSIALALQQGTFPPQVGILLLLAIIGTYLASPRFTGRGAT
jgi:UDP-N-acetylmuramyl pentapeptide phosphotransferase/UDP-N-acetylglucosamine-1-phosphate transferase